MSLVGHFQVEFVDTTSGTRSAGSTDLGLWVNDSAHRYRFTKRQLGMDYGERFFGGSFLSTGGAWIDPENAFRGVKFGGGTLYLGDTGVNDGTGTYLEVRRIGEAGFFGRWTSNMGIEMVIDAKGHRLPDPAGYFCAWRKSRFKDAPGS